MEDYKILFLKSEDIDRVWNGIKPLIEDGLSTIDGNDVRKHLTTDDYYEWAKKDLIQIFIVVKEKKIKLMTITQLLPYPRFKVLEYIMVSGVELKEFSDRLAQTVEDFAKAEKCERMIVTARKGIKKYLKDWEELKDRHKITLMKEL